jgi:hypothetical protein
VSPQTIGSAAISASSTANCRSTPFEGSLGTGRIYGLSHIIEGALQASGRAGSRQVKDANVSFVAARAPIVTGTTFIFVREPY